MLQVQLNNLLVFRGGQYWYRGYFGLAPLPISLNIAIVVVTLFWAGAQLAVWRSKLFERFLGIQWNDD